MSELDIVKQFAQEALTAQAPAGWPDNSLWDRAKRLVRNIEYICRLPEVLEIGSQLDRFCLTAAAYFCDAGLTRPVVSCNNNATSALPDRSAELAEVLNTDRFRHLSTQVVAKKLDSILPAQKIDKINTIIIESGDRLTNMTEAMILSDARNLDDMGLVGVFNEFHRSLVYGRVITDVLQSWKSKIDYRYWQARLKEDFHFEAVRKKASRRLANAESFMKRLSIENSARDLDESTI